MPASVAQLIDAARAPQEEPLGEGASRGRARIRDLFGSDALPLGRVTYEGFEPYDLPGRR
jgi:hypothetical protein